MVGGYSLLAVALLVFLTINGASNGSLVVLGAAALFLAGFLLALAGVLRLARPGFALQALGLIGLVFGLVLLAFVSSLTEYIASAVLIVISGTCAIAGLARAASGGLAILASALIFAGALVVAGADIAGEYMLSAAEIAVYVDVGATIAACGCTLAAYRYAQATPVRKF